jgi:hypothetical protein
MRARWADSGGLSPLAPPLFLGYPFRESTAATLLRCRVPTQFVVGFGNQAGDFDGTTVPINRNERQIARVCVPAFAR